MGIIDSLGEPNENFRSAYVFEGIHDDYISSENGDPVGHGTTVLDIIGPLVQNSTFSTFQVISKDEAEEVTRFQGNRGNTAQAIADAADADVDVLNMSAGVAHECRGLCTISREAELAANVDGVCIVAATGNKMENQIERVGVHCPALSDPVIGVGGYLPKCTAEIYRGEESDQWWLENDTIHGPFCGQVGDCCPGGNCEENRQEKIWGGNISFHNAAPDVLAPVLDVSGSSLSDIQIQAGTSFAAPLVSGLIAGILGDLYELGNEPSIEEIQNAVRHTGTPIDDGGYTKLNTEAVRKYLTSE